MHSASAGTMCRSSSNPRADSELMRSRGVDSPDRLKGVVAGASGSRQEDLTYHGIVGAARIDAELLNEVGVATPVTAPMVGKIVRLVANVGDHVEEDDPIVVME